jgi:hypothetical protein
MGDKENLTNSQVPGAEGQFDDDDHAYNYFVSVKMEAHDRWAAEKKATFIASLKHVSPHSLEQTDHADKLRQERVQALWEGLRRKYFGEIETDSELEDGHPSDSRGYLRDDNEALRRGGRGVDGRT